MEIVFATNNLNKLSEIRLLLPSTITLLSLKDINCVDNLPETGNTLYANALEKSRYIFDKYGYNCFSDDTGLEIDYLDGRPGVYSARYAGTHCSAEDNIKKIFTEMKGASNRNANFRTVIAFIMDNNEFLFEGSINGFITDKKIGNKGFGYDPIFMPSGYDRTFGQMSKTEKSNISHRGKAVDKFLQFLHKQ